MIHIEDLFTAFQTYMAAQHRIVREHLRSPESFNVEMDKARDALRAVCDQAGLVIDWSKRP